CSVPDLHVVDVDVDVVAGVGVVQPDRIQLHAARADRAVAADPGVPLRGVGEAPGDVGPAVGGEAAADRTLGAIAVIDAHGHAHTAATGVDPEADAAVGTRQRRVAARVARTRQRSEERR